MLLQQPPTRKRATAIALLFIILAIAGLGTAGYFAISRLAQAVATVEASEQVGSR